MSCADGTKEMGSEIEMPLGAPVEGAQGQGTELELLEGQHTAAFSFRSGKHLRHVPSLQLGLGLPPNP